MTDNIASAGEGNKSTTKKDLRTEEIQISRELVGVVLGRNGWRINQIKNNTHTNIHIHDKQPSISTVEIIGSAENIQKAKRLVYNLVECRSVKANTICKHSSSCKFDPPTGD